MDETFKYLQETGLTVEDIHNIMQENAILKSAIITAQNRSTKTRTKTSTKQMQNKSKK